MNDNKSANKPSTTSRVRTRREVLRRHRRERQIVVFGILLIALGATAFTAASVYSGRTDGPFQDPIITIAGNDTSGITLPCPPPVTPLDQSRIVVRVLNGTDIQGLAGNTLDKLTGRGFHSGGATNWSRGAYDGAVQLRFGDDGVGQAYTLARHFVDFEMVQDTRSGKSVDVVLGVKFSELNGLRPQFAPELDRELTLTAPAKCVPANEVVEEPAPSRYPDDLPELTPAPSEGEDEGTIVDNDEFSD